MYQGEHQTREGFKPIVGLAFEMNLSRKRKYTEIKI